MMLDSYRLSKACTLGAFTKTVNSGCTVDTATKTTFHLKLLSVLTTFGLLYDEIKYLQPKPWILDNGDSELLGETSSFSQIFVRKSPANGRNFRISLQ